MSWTFTATTWRWEARRDLWVFVHVPAEISEEIAELPHPPAGWDSVRVRVRIGTTRWATSIFPSSDGLYSLAIKKSVREKHAIELGSTVEVELELAR
ncbi:DUF1905 domain-containing protein [Antiquaquibacter soli]|uniref:DUF1905 domain-containing protein n=1 Tax=Antiquaquibacter soli TaxID=3064523 RepID=A0ABT9BN08_9MICO|nr:DUF1905 domain-containing protein [Protaetiibacter sp. WY-16]MDO7882422.1 DUF1905 domain-containing protein [Protaetiibacter sp. WY-16]